MKRITTSFTTLAIVAAIGALAPAGASAKTALTLRTAAGPLSGASWPGGAPILGGGSLTLESAIGKVECPSSFIEGNLRSNGAASDLAELGPGLQGWSVSGTCSSTMPGSSSAEVEFDSYMATVLKKSGKGDIEAYEDSNIIRMDLDRGPSDRCSYERNSKVADTFTPGAAGHPVPVVLSIAQQSLKGEKGKTPCPTLKLSASYALTSEGETVESEL
jgi:hypothetical protein